MDELDEYGNPIIRQPAPEPEPVAPASTWGDWLGNAWGTVTDTVGSVADAVGNAVSGAADTVSSWFQPAEEPVTAPAGDPWNNYFYHDPTPVQQSNDWDNSYTKPAAPAVDYSMFNSDGSLMEPEYSEPLPEPKAYTAPADDNVMAPRGWNVNSGDAEAKQYLADGGNIMGERGWNNTGTPEAAQYLADGGNVMAQNGQDADTQAYLANIKNVIDENNKPEATPKGDLRLSDAANAVLSFPSLGSAKAGAQAGLDIYNYYQKHKEDIESGKVTTAEMGIDFGLLDVLPKVGKSIEKGMNLWDAVTSGKPKTKGQIDLEGKDPWGLVKKADEMGYSPESATGEFVRKVVNPNASTFNKFTSGVGALGDVFQAGAYAVEKGIGIATLNAPRLKALEEIPELGKYKDSLGRLGGLVNLSPVAVALRGLTQPPGTFINKVYNDKPVYLSQVANEYDAYAAKNGWKVDYDVPKTLADIALIKDEGERNKALAALFTRQGFADQRKTSAGKTAEIAYSSLDAQQRAIKRVSFGEDPNTVMHGLSKPNPKASLLKDQEDYADKVKLAIEVAGRQAAYDADQAGYTPEAKAALISKAMTAKAQTISSTGRIEGEANIFAEMLGQTGLDPANMFNPAKIPGVLNVVERGKGITLARDLTKAVDATDEAAVFAAEVAKYQKLTRAPEFVAKIAVAADQAEAAAKAAGTVYKPTVKDFLVSLIDNKFIGRTADTAAHYKAQESITSLGQLVHDPSHFRSPEELVQVLKGYLQQDFQPVEGLSKFSDHVLDGTANSAAWQLGREYSQAAADELLKLANSKTIWSTVDADGKATKLLNSKAFVEKAIEIIGKVRGDKVSEYYKAAGGVEQTRAAVDNIVKMIKGQILSPIFLNTPAQAIQQTVGDRMSSIIDGNWATNIVDGKGWRERFANVAKTGRGFNSQLEGLSDGIQAAQGVKGNSVWTNITHGILKAGAKGEADRWSRSYLGAYEKYIDKVSNYKIGAEFAAKMTPDEVKMVENALNIEHRDPNQVKDIIAKIARGEYKPVDLAEMAGMDNTIFKSKLQTQDRGWLNSLYQRASDEKWTPEKLRETLEGALEEKRNLAKAAMARATQTATTTNPPPHVKLGQDISDEFAMAINDIKTGDIDEPTRAALGKHLQEQTAARTAHMQETNRIAAGIVADTSLIPVEKRADMFHSLFNDEEKLSTAYDAHSLRIRNEMESALKDIPTTPDRFVQRNQVWETYYAEKRSAAQEMNEAKTALHQKYADALKTGDTTIVDSNKTSALEQLKELHTRRNEIVGKYAAATNPERAAYGSADAWEMSQLDGRIAHFNARDGAMRAAYDIGKENPALIGSAFRHVKDAEHDTQIAYDIADAWRRAFENRASINPAYTTKQQDIAQKWKEAFEYAKNRNRAAEWAIRDEGRVRSPNVSDVLEKLNYGKSQREALIQASATSDGYAKLSKILREGKPLEAAAPIAAGAKPVKQQIYDAAIARGHTTRQDGTIDPKRLLDSVNAHREPGTPRFTQKDIFGARSQEALEALKKPLKTGEAPTLVTGEVKRATESVAKVSKQVKQVEGQIDDAQKLIDAARAKIAADMAEFSKTGNHLPGIDIHSEHSKINVWENQVKAHQNNLKNKTAELETAKNTLEAAKGNAMPKMQAGVDKLASDLATAEKELQDVTVVSATQAKDIAAKIKTNEDAIAEILSRRTYPPDSKAGIAQKSKLMYEVDKKLTERGLAMGKVNGETIDKYSDAIAAAKKELAAFKADEKAYKKLVSETDKLKALPPDNSVKEAQEAVAKAKAELDAAKDALEAAKAKGAPVAAAKPAEVIEYGKPGSRHVGTPESVAYNEKGGWKIHLPVENKDYAIVDEWIDKNHAGQYKLLRGGDPQIKDFTIYVGSKDDADAMAKKIHDEIGKYLIPPKEPLSEDRQLYPNVFARFDPGNNNFMGTKGWDNSKAGWRYGIDGIPFDGDTARSRAIDKKVITKDSPEVKAIDAHLKSVYGDYYTGSGKTVAAAPTNVASSATTGATRVIDDNVASRAWQNVAEEWQRGEVSSEPYLDYLFKGRYNNGATNPKPGEIKRALEVQEAVKNGNLPEQAQKEIREYNKLKAKADAARAEVERLKELPKPKSGLSASDPYANTGPLHNWQARIDNAEKDAKGKALQAHFFMTKSSEEAQASIAVEAAGRQKGAFGKQLRPNTSAEIPGFSKPVAGSATTGAAPASTVVTEATAAAAVDPADNVANVINQQAAAHHTTRVGTPPTEIELHQNALKDIEEVLNNAISNIPNIHGKLMANNEAKAWQGIAKELGEHLSKQAFQFRYDTAHIAEALANFSLNDYNDRAGFDSLMQLISPYSYWGSRQGKNYMYRMMENPTLYTHFQKLNNFEEEYNKQRGTPEHMKGKYNLNEMTGGLVSENSPLNSFYAQWKTPAMPMNNLFHIGYDDPVRERTSWQSIYDALPVLGLGPNPIFDIAIRGLGMLVNKTNPDGTPMSKEEIEKQMANYGPASSSPLWGIGVGIGGVTSAMGMNGGMGINPEALLNTAAGVTMRSQETRDIGNAISSQEFLRQANPNYNPQTGVLAQSIHERVNGNAKMRDHYMLDNPKAVARELAVDMKVSEKDAEIALYTYREGVKEASTKRGLTRLFNSLTAMQGAFYGEGEKARDKEQRQERAVGYNADTGYGSLKARQEVQAANPATQTLRAQWATYPGESKDPLVQWEWMEKDRISKSFDDMKDAYIKAHPEDKNGPKKIEDQKWKAWNAVSPAPLKPGETAPATGWEADLAKLASDMKLGKLNSSEVKPIEVPYAPKSIWGANPDEVIEIRKNEILKSYMDKKPSSVDFMDGSGELDFKKYKAALDGWANNAKERLMKDPTTAAVLAQAGKDSEDTQKALNKWLGEVKSDDIKTFKARYDSPLEAMQAVWFDKVYGSATEQYNKLKEGGSKTAWENTIGAIGPMNEDALFKMVKKEYPNLFTDEQLKSALKGITMPSAKDVGIANKDKDLLAVDKAVDSFKATLNGLIPPGKVKSDLLKQNALIAGVQSALFDSEQRKKLTPAMIAEAEMMIRGAANANYIKPNPEEWAKVVAIEKARDEKMQSSYGDGWRDKIGAYFDMSPADRAASVAKYAGLAALVADYTNATKGNTLYEKYHGYKAAGLDGKTGSGGGSGYSTGKSSSSGGSEVGSGAFWDSYHDLTSEEKSQLTKNNPSIKRLLDPATRSGVSATEWAEYNKLVLGKTTKEQLRAAVEAGQTVEQAASTFWGTYRTATTAIKTALAKSDPILAKIVDEKTRGTATKEDFQHAARLFDAVGAVQKAASSGGGGGGSSKAAAPKAAKEPAAKDVSSDIQKQMARLALGLSPVAGKDKAQPVIKATPLKKDSPIKDQMFDTFFSVPLEHRAAMMKDSPLLKLIVNGGAKKAEKDADYIRAIAFMQTWTPAEKAAAKVTAQKAPFKPTSKTSSNYSPYTASSGRSGGGGGGRGGGGRGGGGGGSRFTNRKPPRGKRGPTAGTPIDSIYTSK